MKWVEATWWSSRVKSLELELKILKAHLRDKSQGKPLASLYGVLKDQSESTFEEIEAIKYRIPKKEI